MPVEVAQYDILDGFGSTRIFLSRHSLSVRKVKDVLVCLDLIRYRPRTQNSV